MFPMVQNSPDIRNMTESAVIRMAVKSVLRELCDKRLQIFKRMCSKKQGAEEDIWTEEG
jgi:hypothetical protein